MLFLMKLQCCLFQDLSGWLRTNHEHAPCSRVQQHHKIDWSSRPARIVLQGGTHWDLIFHGFLCPVLLLVLLSVPCGASPPPPPPPPPLTPLSPSSSGCSPTDVDEPEVIDLRPNVSDEFSWLEDDKPARSATTSGADLLAAGSFGPRGDTNVHLIGASLVCDCTRH